MAKLLTTKSLANNAGKSDTPPNRIKIFNWGVNPTLKGDVIVNDETAKVFDENQMKMGREQMALDYEHGLVEGTKAHDESSEPRPVAAHFTAEVIPDDGIYLNFTDWTPSGMQNWKNYCDLSPAPYLDDDNTLIGLHNVALTNNGAVKGLTFLSTDNDLPTSIKADLVTLSVPTKKEGTPDTPPKGYPKEPEKYADPKNHRYPIDTEEHVRAAWSYIHQKKNQSGFNASELATVKSRIASAAKKYGIKLEAMSANNLTINSNNNMDNVTMSAIRRIMSADDHMDDAEVCKAFSEDVEGGKITRTGPFDEGMEVETSHAKVLNIESINKIVADAVKKATAPLTLSVTGITKAQTDARLKLEQDQRDLLVKQATSEGKVIPLSADEIKSLSVPTLTSLVKGLPKSTLATTAVQSPVLQPNADGKIQVNNKLVTMNTDGTVSNVETAKTAKSKIGTQKVAQIFNAQLEALKVKPQPRA